METQEKFMLPITKSIMEQVDDIVTKQGRHCNFVSNNSYISSTEVCSEGETIHCLKIK